MIVVDRLNKSYGNKEVLKDISVIFPKGKITSLIGPNGSGKSTLLMSIGRLLNFDSGRVLIDEINTRDISVRKYAKRISTLRQFNQTNIRLTVNELVEFGRFPHSQGTLSDHDNKVVGDSIKFLGLEKIKNSYLDEISGGQRQMAFIAMIVAQETEIILLDEPLNNLDMKNSVEIMQALRLLCDRYNRSIVLVIHDINFSANYSDYIVALKSGSVFSSGITSDVINNDNLKRLYDIEFDVVKNNNSYICNYYNVKGN